MTDAGGDPVLAPVAAPVAPAAAPAPGPAVAGPASADMQILADRLSRLVQEQGAAPRSSAAMASLAESIQGLVQHMRTEQQMMRDFVETQAHEQQELRRTLERLALTLQRQERG